MEILNIKNINIEELEYGKPIQSTFGGQIVSILKNKNKMYIQTPKCKIPYGVSNYINFNMDSDTRASEDFKKFLKTFDNKNIETATMHSKQWFKKLLDKEVVKDLYKEQLHDNTFVAKFPTKDGKFIGEVFNSCDEPIEAEKIEPGCSIQAIIECVGMYFIPKQFGITWKIHQVKIFPKEKDITGFSFIDSDEDT